MTDAKLDGQPCPICRTGVLRQGTHTDTLERSGAVVVVKHVPGWLCDSCGESYTDEQTTERVLQLATEAFERGAEVEVLRFSPGSGAKEAA